MWLGLLIGFVLGAYAGIILMATMRVSGALNQSLDSEMDEPPYLY